MIFEQLLDIVQNRTKAARVYDLGGDREAHYDEEDFSHGRIRPPTPP
jgi:hypothetical protein